jgi:hypothetical protein
MSVTIWLQTFMQIKGLCKQCQDVFSVSIKDKKCCLFQIYKTVYTKHMLCKQKMYRIRGARQISSRSYFLRLCGLNARKLILRIITLMNISGRVYTHIFIYCMLYFLDCIAVFFLMQPKQQKHKETKSGGSLNKCISTYNMMCVCVFAELARARLIIEKSKSVSVSN